MSSKDRVEPLRLGVVGCGRVAERRHLIALQSVPEIEVTALVDIDRARCEALADRFAVSLRFGSVDQLLASSRVDALAVLTPSSTHAEIALAALEAGKSVFVEKPLALTLEAADLLVEGARRSPATVMVGFNLRWHRLVQRARTMLLEGAIGRVVAVASAFTDPRLAEPELPDWRRTRDLGGGAMLEKLVHHFDLWHFLLDDEVDEVSGLTRSGRAEDEVTAVMGRTSQGTLAQALGTDLTSMTNVVTLYGDKGTIRLDLLRFDGLERLSLDDVSGAPRVRARQLAGAAGRLAVSLGELRRGGSFPATYAAEWEHFADAVRARRPSGCTFEDGRRALRIALAAAESAELGRSVRITPSAAEEPASAR